MEVAAAAHLRDRPTVVKRFVGMYLIIGVVLRPSPSPVECLVGGAAVLASCPWGLVGPEEQAIPAGWAPGPQLQGRPRVLGGMTVIHRVASCFGVAFLATISAGALRASASAAPRVGNGDVTVLIDDAPRDGPAVIELSRYHADGRSYPTLGGRYSGELASCGRTPADACPGRASYSADGRRVAFPLGDRLAIAAPDGSGRRLLPRLRVLTAQDAEDSDPALAPDGRRLVFTGRHGRRRDLYVVGADGRGLHRLTARGGAQADWSTRGSVAYVSRGVIYRLTPGRRGRVRVAAGQHPRWTRSGRAILFDRGGNAYRVTARRGARRRLLARHATDPVPSPDGRRLLFLRFTPAGAKGASVYQARTSGRDARVFGHLIGDSGDNTPTANSYLSIAWQPRPRPTTAR